LLGVVDQRNDTVKEGLEAKERDLAILIQVFEMASAERRGAGRGRCAVAPAFSGGRTDR
jgi:hypothetical protein